MADVERISYASASLKINVALAELPGFPGAAGYRARAPASRHDPHLSGPGLHRARVRRRQVRPAFGAAGAGVHDSLGRRPTVAPPGRHLMSMFVQYAPYELRDGTWDDQREAFADRCFDVLDEYAPNFKRSVLDRQVLTPSTSNASST